MPTIINSHIYRATTITISIFNFLYTIGTLHLFLVHPNTAFSRRPNILDCYIATNRHTCNIPRNAIFYNVSRNILLTKATAFPTALLAELITAVYIVKKGISIQQLPHTKAKKVCSFILQGFILWQMFTFVQIMVGLVSIPFLILLLISPAQTILLAGAATIIAILITGFIVSIPLPKSHRFNPKCCVKSCFYYVEILLIILVVSSASTTYCFIVKQGISMGGVKGYIMSLIPTIPISIIIWMIKGKLLGKKNKRKERELTAVLVQRRDSFSTEEEIIDFSTNSEDSAS